MECLRFPLTRSTVKILATALLTFTLYLLNQEMSHILYIYASNVLNVRGISLNVCLGAQETVSLQTASNVQ
jgi:hypothetical protein